MLHSSAAGKVMRFAVVGAICAVLYFHICYGLKAGLGWSAFSAALVAYLICFAIGYAGQKSFAFQSSSGHAKSLPRYAVLQLGVGLFTAVSTEWAAHVMDFSAFYVSAFATLVAGAISFLVSYRWVFQERPVPRAGG
jgi:putative flippase GtrA